MALRTFTKLQSDLSVEELDQFAERIAKSYAESDGSFSRSYYTKLHNITADAFYQLLYRAVITDLVTDEIVEKMRRKASINSNAKSKENAGKMTMGSNVKYQRLIRQRKWFIFLRDFPEDKKIEITTYFAENSNVSKEKCAKKFNLTRSALEKILEDALVHNLVGDDIFLKIRTRSLGDNPTIEAKNYFTQLKKKRNSKKKTAK